MRKILIIVMLLMFLILVSCSSGNDTELKEDLVIQKSDISEKAKFYPMKINGTNMEVFAVKASDGSIRTAFNTCQICNGSPKAYFEQNDKVMFCQNCGNEFLLDMIEKEKGGCNPIPISGENKTDSGDEITIKLNYLEENSNKFPDNWKMD